MNLGIKQICRWFGLLVFVGTGCNSSCLFPTSWQSLQSSKPTSSRHVSSPSQESSKPTGSKRTPLSQRGNSSIYPLERKFKANQTFAFVLPQLPPLAGVGPVRAALCQNCHTDIAQEWKQSTHAAALRDLQYQAELSKPGSPQWLCLNCHIPVQNQRKHIVRGLRQNDIFQPVLEKNPGFDPEMRKEAITCATCHVRVDKNGKSYVIGAIGSKLSPHPVRQDKAFLRKTCLRCHDPQGERLTKHLLCWFKTRDEWTTGPHRHKDCVDCHMPQRQRRLVPAWSHLPVRTSHQHHWVGGGVPKDYAGYNTLLQRGYHSGLAVQWLATTPAQAGRTLALHLRLENKYAGHWLPTADPERYLLFQALLLDQKDRVIQKQTLRIGQLWKWEPMAEKIGDNRLKPREVRNWKPTLLLPKTPSPLRLRVQVYHVRLSSQTARYMVSQAATMKGVTADVQKQIANLGSHYPLATLIYREDSDITTKQRRKYSAQELIDLSRQEQHKPLHLRDY